MTAIAYLVPPLEKPPVAPDWAMGAAMAPSAPTAPLAAPDETIDPVAALPPAEALAQPLSAIPEAEALPELATETALTELARRGPPAGTATGSTVAETDEDARAQTGEAATLPPAGRNDLLEPNATAATAAPPPAVASGARPDHAPLPAAGPVDSLRPPAPPSALARKEGDRTGDARENRLRAGGPFEFPRAATLPLAFRFEAAPKTGAASAPSFDPASKPTAALPGADPAVGPEAATLPGAEATAPVDGPAETAQTAVRSALENPNARGEARLEAAARRKEASEEPPSETLAAMNSGSGRASSGAPVETAQRTPAAGPSRVEAPAPASAVASPPEPPPAAASGPKQLAVRVEAPPSSSPNAPETRAAAVEIVAAQRGSTVQVALHSADPLVTAEIRAHAPELAARLERTGWETSGIPGAPRTETVASLQASDGARNQDREQSPGERGQQQSGQQQQQNPRRQPFDWWGQWQQQDLGSNFEPTKG